MMATKATERQWRYDKDHTKAVHLKLNKVTDADILEWLEHFPSKQGYIKQLIRIDIKNHE